MSKKIVVIGDIFIDRFVFGDIFRINPESPAPLLKKKQIEERLGGAANVANNICSLGGDCLLIGKGDKKLRNLLKNIDTLIFDSKTNIKERYICKNQHILRVDEEEKHYLSDDEIDKICSIDMDIVVISDYGKGMINDNLMKKLKEKNIKILVDPKKIKTCFKDVYLVKPNIYETAQAVTVSLDNLNILEEGKKLQKELNSILLITRGKDGMTLFKDKISHYPITARNIFDVTGAGDTVIATIAYGISKGKSLHESILLANKAAGIVVGKIGTSTVTQSEINNINFLTDKDLENLKKTNKKIVFTNGCFDILHTGHIDLLKKAKSYGEVLIVGLNTDESIKKIKGKNRPINNQEERAEIISSLKDVDYVVFFNEETPKRIISKIKPNFHVKGGDYTFLPETEVVKKNKGEVKIVDFVKKKSTTDIIRKIKKLETN